MRDTGIPEAWFTRTGVDVRSGTLRAVYEESAEGGLEDCKTCAELPCPHIVLDILP